MGTQDLNHPLDLQSALCVFGLLVEAWHETKTLTCIKIPCGPWSKAVLGVMVLRWQQALSLAQSELHHLHAGVAWPGVCAHVGQNCGSCLDLHSAETLNVEFTISYVLPLQVPEHLVHGERGICFDPVDVIP